MKNITLLFVLLLMGVSGSSYGSDYATFTRPNDAVIFVEDGVEFAVFPDGQFDFFFNPRRNGFNVNVVSPNVNISFNSGYNYDPYVQYDDYGAVVQIERVPIYYDYYGRIIQAGNIVMNYDHRGRLNRVGGLHLHYNLFGQLAYTSGRINTYNVRYVARPWHRYYAKPRPAVAVVFHQPYRAYYHPHRVSYVQYKNYYSSHPRPQVIIQNNFYRPGTAVTEYRRGSRSENRVELPASQTEVRSNKNTVRNSTANIRSRSTQSNEVRSTSRERGQEQARPAARVPSRNTSTNAPTQRSVSRSVPATQANQQQSVEARARQANAARPAVRKQDNQAVSRTSRSRSSVSTPSPAQRQARAASPARTSVQKQAAPSSRSRTNATNARSSRSSDSNSNVRSRGL